MTEPQSNAINRAIEAQLSVEIEKIINQLKDGFQALIDGVAALPASTWAACDPVKEPPRGPSPIEAAAQDFFKYLDACKEWEENAARIRSAFWATYQTEGGRLEVPDETTDDFTERRIAQAERVMALYKAWDEMAYPPHMPVSRPEEGQEPSFQGFLEGTLDEIIKAMAMPVEITEQLWPAEEAAEPGPVDFWAKADCESRGSMYFHWWPDGNTRTGSACGEFLQVSNKGTPRPTMPESCRCDKCFTMATKARYA